MCSVFILYKNALFARGLERLLRQEGVKVVGSAMQDRQAIDRIKGVDLDVVIVETGREKSAPEILLSRLLQERCQARVVRLNLEDNTCIFYSGRRCTTNSAEDLVQCVLSSMAAEQPMRSRSTA